VIPILGIDLAWGEKKNDGLCLLEASQQYARVKAIDYTHGDDALVGWMQKHIRDGPSMILVDAPLVCPKASGSRPVDKQISSMFWRQHAGCHPANSAKCPRPVRIAKKLAACGFDIGWDMKESKRLLIEVYPHPAIVRLFGLDCIVKYKKGRVAGKRREFRRLQALTRKYLNEHFPKFHMTADLGRLLKEDWSKAVEDRTDAFLCALIGYNHYLFQGAESEVVGTRDAGFILLPK
jgi:predicted RNase H-like nuclease